MDNFSLGTCVLPGRASQKFRRASRQQAHNCHITMLSKSLRTARTAVRSGVLASSLRLSTRTASNAAVFARAANASAARFYSSLNTADAELIASLKSEISLEKESQQQEDDNELIKTFLDKSGFRVVQTPGYDEVELVKANGSETIHIYFSLSDVSNDLVENEFEADVENGESEVADDELGNNPIRVNIVIEKAGSAIGVEAVVHEDVLLVESMAPYETASLATADTPEAEFKRKCLFQGPPFASLDESVQNSVERYLEARGVDSSLAEFILEYASQKENDEYIAWLEKLKGFVEK